MDIPLYLLIALITKSSGIVALSFMGILAIYDSVVEIYYGNYLKKHGYVPKYNI